MERIRELKSEVYDIMRKQEQLNIEFNILQEQKVKKSQEIKSLEIDDAKPENPKEGDRYIEKIQNGFAMEIKEFVFNGHEWKELIPV